jgi:hypothetical protein
MNASESVIRFSNTGYLPTGVILNKSFTGGSSPVEKDAPTTRRVQTPPEGPVVAFPEVGGLHHRYERRVA